jgi:hypothetical protein
LEPGQDVPVKLWIDDIDVRFVDLSQMGGDPEEGSCATFLIEGIYTFSTCPLDRTEAKCSPGEKTGTIVAPEEGESRKAGALFPREGGWLPGLGQARDGERCQAEAAEEGAQGRS